MTKHEILLPGSEYVALSLRPPWAWAVLFGGKDVENRSWPTNRRGRILIHASGHKASMHDEDQLRTLVAALARQPKQALPADFARSAILGSVELVDCVRNAASHWAEPGQYHWILRDPRPLAVPIRGVHGKLQFWRWSHGAAQTVAEEAKAARNASPRSKTDVEAGSTQDHRTRQVDPVGLDRVLSAFGKVAQTEAMEELDLLRAASRELGHQRLGARVQRELKARLRTAIRRGVLVRDGRRLRRGDAG